MVGNKPYYLNLKACVTRLWKPSCSLDIHSRENCFFFFKFGDSDECDRILQTGPWLFDGRLIVLKKWNEHIGLERDLQSSVPIWVHFPSLHLKLWSRNIIGRIASIVRNSNRMDKATAHSERLAYACCFIEVSASKPLP